MSRVALSNLVSLFGLVALTACEGAPGASQTSTSYATPHTSPGVTVSVDGALAPLPDDTDVSSAEVRLGARLFEDKRVSTDSQVACSSCHNLKLGGANGERRSNLPGRDPVGINVPSVFNLAYNFRFAWSGKFVDVAQQIDAAMKLEEAMGTTWSEAAARISGDDSYVREFKAAYGEGPTAANLRDALSRYCLSMSTPNSKFDRYLRGKAELSDQEARGYDRFRGYGCVSCHQGVNVGGNMYQRFGVMGDYFVDRGKVTNADLGLFAVTGREEDRHVFRVPSLRNVEQTAPYFHDGSAATLVDAVQTMARYQLGREIDDEPAEDIAAFLKTLTGELRHVTKAGDGQP